MTMAQMRDIYLPSNDCPGKVWRIGYYKPERQPALITAYEGERHEHPGLGHSWTCDMFGCRRYRTQLQGRATKKAIAGALAALVEQMKEAGVIAAEIADRLILQAQGV
jgi:hypothetical protein